MNEYLRIRLLGWQKAKSAPATSWRVRIVLPMNMQVENWYWYWVRPAIKTLIVVVTSEATRISQLDCIQNVVLLHQHRVQRKSQRCGGKSAPRKQQQQCRCISLWFYIYFNLISYIFAVKQASINHSFSSPAPAHESSHVIWIFSYPENEEINVAYFHLVCQCLFITQESSAVSKLPSSLQWNRR